MRSAAAANAAAIAAVATAGESTRLRPSADGSRLDYEMTVTDPATFTRPVVLRQHWLWLPSVTLLPYECAVR